MKIFNKLILGSALCLACSCASDFVETTPTDTLPGESIITDQASAESALNGLYSAIQFDYNTGGYDTFLTGLYTDELVHTGSFPSFAEFSVNDPAINNIDNTRYWNNHYSAIYRANLIIKFSEESSVGLSEEATARIVGQARGLRALMYYDLVKAYGGVPLELNAYTSATDIDTNPIARSTASEVYSQIVEDVQFAVNNIPAGLNRFAFNKNAAIVLKAQVEMEMGMYPEAESTLEPLIDAYSLESDYSALFTGAASASEAIFAVDFNETDGSNAAFFYLNAGRGEVGASDILINAFEDGDARIGQISSAGEVIKYKDAGSGNDDAYVFRYAEVLLMYAEVLARQDNPDASIYINLVRERAGLGPVELTSANVVDLIAQERFVELYAESSDRFHTATRLGIADAIIQAKAGNIVFVDARNNLWPIPQQEIERNSEISTADQNPGY
jgi:starch-binding outer membrane protein, SusD/RagB family